MAMVVIIIIVIFILCGIGYVRCIDSAIKEDRWNECDKDDDFLKPL